MVFQKSFQGVSRKFHMAWHSSQLPELKEGFDPEVDWQRLVTFAGWESEGET